MTKDRTAARAVGATRRPGRGAAWLAVGAGGVCIVLAIAPAAEPATTTIGAAPVISMTATEALEPSAPVVARSFVPVAVGLPALDVTARVQPMGLRPNRDLDIPADPAVVGWWDGSARAGSVSGQTVLAGHVYNRGFGVGALADLGDLRPGDPVVVAGDDGAARQYTVTTVEHYRKASLPLDVVFGQHTDPRLVLITCGNYDKRLDRYLDNIVVFADPA